MKQALVTATALSLMAGALACSQTRFPCEEMVRGHLKAPATAEFTIRYSDYRETVGWVDAQNSYGAKIRTGFVCQLGDDLGQIKAGDRVRIAFTDEPKTSAEGRLIRDWIDDGSSSEGHLPAKTPEAPVSLGPPPLPPPTSFGAEMRKLEAERKMEAQARKVEAQIRATHKCADPKRRWPWCNDPAAPAASQ